jgi:hypothetical protein
MIKKSSLENLINFCKMNLSENLNSRDQMPSFKNLLKTLAFFRFLKSFMIFWVQNFNQYLYLYYYNILILCMCLTGYRLGPWRSYRLEIGIIRTSMTWGCAKRRNFPEKWPAAELPNKGYATYVLYRNCFIAFSF